MEKSESIINLAKALLKFDAEMGKVNKGETNPFFKNKYASLPDILAAIKEPLLKAGLTVKQFPQDENALITIIIHAETGEFLSCKYSMKAVKDDPQQQGSRITYQRRYAIGAVLGLNIDEDDDGNKASLPQPKFEEKNEDNRPWLSEKAFIQASERIVAGEKEVYQKTIDAFKMKKEYKEKLTELSKNQ